MIAKLPKVFQASGLRTLGELNSRVYQWISGAQDTLRTLKQACEEALLPRAGGVLAGDLDANTWNVTDVGALNLTPVGFRWVAGAAALDVSLYSYWTAANRLTQDVTLTLTGGEDGMSGGLVVRQDGTGGWDLDLVVSGRVILREFSATDSDPQAGANSITQYSYSYFTLAGQPTVLVARSYLT